MMQLTTEQQKAVRSQGNTLLDACPGSGKTRAIVAKVLRCVDDVRDTPRKIAVITYTNAVYEIESRLRIYGTTAISIPTRFRPFMRSALITSCGRSTGAARIMRTGSPCSVRNRPVSVHRP